MLTLNFERDEFIMNLHSFGEGVRHYSLFNRVTAESNVEIGYDEDTRTADENIVKDGAILLEQGWRIA